ncbi:MAG: SCO family protein [Bacteroidetes bacterium HGW-Bacteroidetes-2]|jgi:protein SCO1/2|nr:MAG: SCO family protein [Bacteroidetes bacterium HGW-Bacteroidetes-2]
MKNYSYIGISFVILVFGIWAVPKIIETLKKPDFAILNKVPDFSFTDQNGKTITNETYIGKVYVLEFFFTTCPSICPIMNQNMLKLQNEFYGNPNFGIASITIDPMHDTPQTLKKYAQEHGIIHPNWHLLTGEKEIIYQLSNEGFKLYSAQDEKVEGGFEHSGLFALIDKEGNIRSRKDEFGNSKFYYNGLEDVEIKMLKEDIKKLL